MDAAAAALYAHWETFGGTRSFFLAITKNFTPIQIHKYSLDPLAFFI